VLNLHASMARIGLGEKLVVRSLDSDAHRCLADMGLRSTLSEGAAAPGWSDWGTPGFAKAMSFKYSVALAILGEGKNALYVDSDIVLLRDPVDYMRAIASERSSDLVMQFESPKNVYCAGFWLAAPTAGAVELFSKLLAALGASNDYVDDQETLNGILKPDSGFAVHALDPELFACGNQFLDGLPVSRGGYHIDRRVNPFPMDSAYLLHFNYVMGKREKAAAMVKRRVAFHPRLASVAREGKLLRRLLGRGPE
jgi:hypothetical protein